MTPYWVPAANRRAGFALDRLDWAALDRPTRPSRQHPRERRHGGQPAQWLRPDLDASGPDCLAHRICRGRRVDQRERRSQLPKSVNVGVADKRFAMGLGPPHGGLVEVELPGIHRVHFDGIDERRVGIQQAP